eukprot:g308.t1
MQADDSTPIATCHPSDPARPRPGGTARLQTGAGTPPSHPPPMGTPRVVGGGRLMPWGSQPWELLRTAFDFPGNSLFLLG